MITPPLAVALAGLCTGAAIDAFNGRLPNWLTFSMTAVGIAIHASSGQISFALLGVGLALLIHFPLFALNVVRAGDAKLVMGAGALIGWHEVIDLTAWYACIYLPVGFAFLIAKRRLGNLASVARHQVRQARGIVVPQQDKPELTMLRTGPIIALAGIMAVFTDWFHFV
ncbi:MAG: hypothetical protein GWP91_07440 [Rhodobacterales bacterium]|nr:hypothetical protein [Rhodobacterales bacterium]